jgi:hypothetical protein
MRELLSNTIPAGSNWGQVLECAADKVIILKDKSKEKQRTSAKQARQLFKDYIAVSNTWKFCL